MKNYILIIFCCFIANSCTDNNKVIDNNFNFHNEIKNHSINSFRYRKYYNFYGISNTDTLLNHTRKLKELNIPVDSFLTNLSDSIFYKGIIIKDISQYDSTLKYSVNLINLQTPIESDQRIIFLNNFGYEIISRMAYSIEFNVRNSNIDKNSKEFKKLYQELQSLNYILNIESSEYEKLIKYVKEGRWDYIFSRFFTKIKEKITFT